MFLRRIKLSGNYFKGYPRVNCCRWGIRRNSYLDIMTSTHRKLVLKEATGDILGINLAVYSTVYRESSSWSYTEFSLSLCYRIRFSVVLRSSYLLAALSFTTTRRCSSLFSGFSSVPTLQGLGTQHSRRACVIGVKCHGKELISSIIIIYGSLCVHLPQNTKHKIQNTKHKYGFSSNLFYLSLSSLHSFLCVFFIRISVLIGVWVARTQKTSHRTLSCCSLLLLTLYNVKLTIFMIQIAHCNWSLSEQS